MQSVGEAERYISRWEAAGLIDAETAARLRAAEASEPERPQAGDPALAQASAMFGPNVTIPELFGYLGSAFLLAGWVQVVARISGPDGETTLGITGLLTAVVLVALGFLIRREEPRRRRAAGVAFLVSVPFAAAGTASLLASIGVDGPPGPVLAAGVGLVVALALRLIHPSLLTQVGLLGAITSLSVTVLRLAESVLVPETGPGGSPIGVDPGPGPLALLLLSAAWWLATAVVIGLIGLREADVARAADGRPAGHRAAISRLWAGIVAVIGLSTAVTRSGPQADGTFDRVLAPWIGELAIVVLSVILLERAFRRDATSFVYAAALGLIIALSDFNFSYLSDTTEIGLVIEGAILLAVGIAADRLRRRIAQARLVPAG
jgi:hypothetical protein